MIKYSRSFGQKKEGSQTRGCIEVLYNKDWSKKRIVKGELSVDTSGALKV